MPLGDYCIPPGQSKAKVVPSNVQSEENEASTAGQPGTPKNEPRKHEETRGFMDVDAVANLNVASAAATEEPTGIDQHSAEMVIDSDFATGLVGKGTPPPALDPLPAIGRSDLLQQAESKPALKAESQIALATVAASPVDLQKLREQLTLRKAQGKARAVASPAADETAAITATNRVADSPRTDASPAQDDGKASSSLNTIAAQPTAESRTRDSPIPTEPRSRLPSRRSSITSDSSLVPRGPRADLDRDVSRTTRPSSPMAGRSRDVSPGIKTKDDMLVRSREMPPPPAPPRELRDEIERQTRSDTPPHRPSRSRNGSTESRASRISLSKRDADRRRKPYESAESRKAEDDRRDQQPEELLRDKDRGTESRRSERTERERERDRDREREAERRRDRDRDRDRGRDREHDVRDKAKDRIREREDRQRGRGSDKDRSAELPRKDAERTRDRSDRARGDERPRTARERDERRSDRDARPRDRDNRDRDRDRNRSRDSERASKMASKETASDRTSDRLRGDRERERSPIRDSRREKDQSTDAFRATDTADRYRGDRSSRRDEAARGTARQEEPPFSETERRDPRTVPDVLISRSDVDRRDPTPTGALTAPGQARPRSRPGENGQAHVVPQNSQAIPDGGNLTPRLAERMGLSSRNEISPDAPGVQVERARPEVSGDRNSSNASAIESLTLRIDRDPPPHAAARGRRDGREDPFNSSRTHERPVPAASQAEVRRSSSSIENWNRTHYRSFPAFRVLSRNPCQGVIIISPRSIRRAERKRKSWRTQHILSERP